MKEDYERNYVQPYSDKQDIRNAPYKTHNRPCDNPYMLFEQNRTLYPNSNSLTYHQANELKTTTLLQEQKKL